MKFKNIETGIETEIDDKFESQIERIKSYPDKFQIIEEKAENEEVVENVVEETTEVVEEVAEAIEETAEVEIKKNTRRKSK